MGIDGVGSSVIIALAAVLWLVYLVPTWLKRREYLATERNAVRLQQTMRIMAESAEVPSVVRVEANARAVAAQRAALRMTDRHSLPVPHSEGTVSRPDAAVSFPVAKASRPEVPASRPEVLEGGSVVPGMLRTQRLRRSRAFASLVLLAAVIATGFGVFVLVTTGAWALMAASALVSVGALALLGQLAAVGNARDELLRAQRGTADAHRVDEYPMIEAEKRETGWIPVPLPKPLYLSNPVPVGPSVALDDSHRDLLVGLRRAAEEAERALRKAQAAPEVTRITPPPSKFAAMGIVDERDVVRADLDDILRRRRMAG